MGTGAVSLGLKQLRREADSLCPFNPKIKNMLSCFNYNQLMHKYISEYFLFK